MESVAKGCFVVKGIESSKSAKQKKLLLDPSSYLESKTQSNVTRHLMSKTLWDDMNKLIADLNKNMQSSLLKDIIKFIKTSHTNRNNIMGQNTEIPSAVLIMGVNMPDHMQFFKKIIHEVKEDISPHMALLKARYCSTVKNLMKQIGQQLILKTDNLQDSELDASINENGSNEKNVFSWKPNTPLTLTVLEKWYKQQSKSVPAMSPTKKRKVEENKPIVIIFYDTESFKSSVLQDLISMLCSVITSIPIVLLFGVATSWASVADRQIPHSSIVNLALEQFHALSASDQLSMIIDKVVLSNAVPFKMTGKCLQILLDVFLYHDFSTQNFINNFHFCILEHFYKRKESILCLSSIKDIVKTIDNLEAKDLSHFRRLSSVTHYYTTVTSSIANRLKKDDEFFKSNMVDWMYNLHEYHLVFFLCLRCLHALSANLPRHPLGKQLREIFSMCSRSVLVDSEDYKEAQLYWKVTSREQLKSYISDCTTILNEFSDDTKKDFPSNFKFELILALEDTLEFLKHVCQNFDNLINQDENETKEQPVAENEETPKEPIVKVKYAYQLKEKLKSQAQKKSAAKMTNFEKLRLEFVDFMHNLFSLALIRAESFPMYEAFYFNSSGILKHQVVASPRLAIQKSLTNPHSYIQADCLKLEFPGAIPKNSPDVSIAYKLHSECGRIINLYDWMTAFYTIISDVEDDEQPIDIDEVAHARFIRAASELQMLGFIKPTKHKADHVMRLTWSCM